LRGLAAVGALMATPVLGADTPVKAPPTATVPVYSWTGCYIGANVGGIREHDSTPVTLSDPTGIATVAFVTGRIASGFSYDRGRALGGGQFGCNWQITNWVVGIETDFDARSSRRIGTAFCSLARPAWPMRVCAIHTSRAMRRQVGRLAFLHRIRQRCSAGGGAEVGFGQWSVKGGALYYDLGKHSLAANCTVVTGAACATPNTVFTPHFQNRGVITRIGLNYHFNTGPVASKY
jgi:hypothetical protein